jgi:hypothetical protein
MTLCGRLPLPRRFGVFALRLHVVNSTQIVSQRSGSIAKDSSMARAV